MFKTEFQFGIRKSSIVPQFFCIVPTSTGMGNNYGMEKVLVGLAIEHTLLQIGKPVFDKVENQFQRKYQHSLIDGYDYPQYLNEILREVFGKSHSDIIKSIEEFLEEFKHDQPIETFIEKIKQ
ncbi:hypothetical protein DYY67_0237 [Candidatus Nitrosotalea sp. TS]|nr:hypothetical protein [Candidatus Nitrosotalea sp. TS]